MTGRGPAGPAPPDDAGRRREDVIREVVNIGAGHAATSLSTLTGQRVMISVPRIYWGGAEAALRAVAGAGDAESIVSVAVPIGEGATTGEHARLVLHRATALRVAALMLRRDPATTREFGLLERSTLAELGNIVTAAYVGVLGSFAGSSVTIGTPEFSQGSAGTFRSLLGSGLLIETEFSFPDAAFAGILLLSHADASFDSILAGLGLRDTSG